MVVPSLLVFLIAALDELGFAHLAESSSTAHLNITSALESSIQSHTNEPIADLFFANDTSASWTVDVNSSVVAVNATGTAETGFTYLTETALRSTVYATIESYPLPSSTASPQPNTSVYPTWTEVVNGTTYPTWIEMVPANGNQITFKSWSEVLNGTTFPNWTEVVHGSPLATEEAEIATLVVPRVPVTSFCFPAEQTAVSDAPLGISESSEERSNLDQVPPSDMAP